MASWVKGQSGNPGGKPKALRNVVELARKRTVRAIQALTRIMESSEDDGARVRAATVLLERGWGKPSQAIDVTHHDARPTEMTRDQLLAVIAESRPEPEPAPH